MKFVYMDIFSYLCTQKQKQIRKEIMKKYLVIHVLDYSINSVHQLNIDLSFAYKYFGITDIENIDEATTKMVEMVLYFYGFKKSSIDYMATIKKLKNGDSIVKPNIINCNLEDFIACDEHTHFEKFMEEHSHLV